VAKKCFEMTGKKIIIWRSPE